ncbi:MAG: hypothetical protein AABW46_02775 [Nanoarchaeota archaeon]
MDKRGQELSLNTLVIIILLVIALVVIAVFFLGGTSSLSQSIRSIFHGAKGGTDLSLAVEICQQRCEQAKSLPETLVKNSAYCDQPFELDLNNDGEAERDDSGVVKFYCSDPDIGVKCSGIDDKC